MAEVNEVEEALSKLRESDFSTGETYEKARLEALRSAMESAKDAIKACLLINGGAAGGLLAFMGHLATVGNDLLIRGLLVSLLLFGGGLITAIIAHGTAYASHFNFARFPTQKVENLQRIRCRSNDCIDPAFCVRRLSRVSRIFSKRYTNKAEGQ